MSDKTILTVAMMLAALPVAARENIQISGSSTVLPYATIVAELFGENFEFRTPVVEGGGSGAGRKKLCEGLGEGTIDIANSSSRIKQSDLDLCASNGVTGVMEVRFGYDGIVFAALREQPDFVFGAAEWYRALGAQIVEDGKLVPNRLRDWSEVDPSLPSQEIAAYIPGTKHGTREVFDHNVLLAGCKATGAFDLFADAAEGDEAAKEEAAESGCLTLRTDGVAVDIDGDYTETLARVQANPIGIGVFGLSFYQSNADRLRVYDFDGVTPSVESIASGTYPVSRPLYFYVKLAHLGVIPGLREYIAFFLSDEVAGPDGPLADYGLVSDPLLHETQAMIAAEQPMEPLSQ
ncbi:PstS family phosphate ABC transporter substrate-binding protein [Tabrizicola sp. M-4]|uniref:PstS family phosphate ABC transporter substrate-binding protein n=1 Tax=Tabrizicola sp. M-4 TaxID=3055847 RepID=UPI003DA8ECC0